MGISANLSSMYPVSQAIWFRYYPRHFGKRSINFSEFSSRLYRLHLNSLNCRRDPLIRINKNRLPEIPETISVILILRDKSLRRIIDHRRRRGLARLVPAHELHLTGVRCQVGDFVLGR